MGDVRRELTFCRKTGLQVVGIVENMSGFVCPHCTVSRGDSSGHQPLRGPGVVRCALGGENTPGSVPGVCEEFLTGGRTSAFQECTNVFSRGGGAELARLTGVPFLGEHSRAGAWTLLRGSELPAAGGHEREPAGAPVGWGWGAGPWPSATLTARPLPYPFAGSVPLDPELTRSLEEGRDFIRDFPQSPAFPALSSIAQKVLSEAPARLS